MQDFEGKNVVVTGASGGLGAAVVAALLERGAVCHLPMIEREVPAKLPWHGHARVHAYTGTHFDEELQVAAFYDALPTLWASVHLVGGFAMAPILETPYADFQRMMTLNAGTCFLCCREAVRAMRRSGGGRIVNVAARPALTPTGGMIAYSASKAAVASITQSLAAEVLSEKILVNAIVPSIIDTASNRASMPKADFAAWPKAEEIAEAIAFLASPQNALTSGTLLPVYGRA